MRDVLVPVSLALACACSSHGTSAAGAVCDGAPDASDSDCVARVDGKVTDLAGAPVPHAAVSMCSRVCYGAAGEADGRFSIAVGAWIRPSDYALHVSGRPGFADVFTKVARPSGGAIVLPASIRIPALPPAGPLLPAIAGPATRVTSADVTLDVPAGATFELDVGDVALGDLGHQLRAVAVPLDDAPDFAVSIPGLAALYALAPPGATSSATLGLHLTNAAGLAPGAAVDVLVLDDDYTPLPPTAGTARLVASAHVSADGRTIDTDSGQGISHLTWLAIASRP